MKTDWHVTVRHALWVLGAVVVFFFAISRIFPEPKPVHGPVAVFTPSPVEHETQALIDALQTVAQSKSGVSVLQHPAVDVIRSSGVANGLTDAQIAQILGALKAKTVEKVAVGSKLVGPSPKPYTGTDTELYSADYSATVQALHDTHIQTDVTISREEVPPSRIGSFISAGGSGLSFAAYRHKQYELDLAGVEVQSHIAPAVSLQYLIPHTSLSIGPDVIYNHGARIGIAATVHF